MNYNDFRPSYIGSIQKLLILTEKRQDYNMIYDVYLDDT